jgi:hypothetical protein
MSRPSPYPRELRERAARMVAEVRPRYESEYAAIAAPPADRPGRYRPAKPSSTATDDHLAPTGSKATPAPTAN